MKRLLNKRLYCVILMISLLLGCFGQIPVFAELQTQDLVSVSTPCDILVQLTYDNQKPTSVAFISPSGVRYQEGVSPESELKFYEGTGWIHYKIFNAEAGLWTFEYDKGNSVNAEISVALSTANLAINDFKVTNVSGTTADVSFETVYDGSGISYNYEIYAVAGSGADEGKKLLTTGSARTDEVVTRQVNLSNLSSFNAYRLALSVYSDLGSHEIFDDAQTAEFSYQNPNAPDAIDGIDILVDTKKMTVTLSWQNYNYGNDLFVTAFADGSTEPIYYENLADYSERQTVFDYTEANSTLSIQVYKRQNGVLSAPWQKDIDLKNLAVEIPTPENTNRSQAEVVYNMKESGEGTVTLNGESSAVRLDGNGTFAVSLTDGYNDLAVTYTQDQVQYRVSKDLFLDRVAPELILYEDIDQKSFNTPDVIIVGKTEIAATLTINGQPIQIDAAGEFSPSIALKDGQNIIEIKATDPAGNSSSYTVSLVCNATPTVENLLSGSNFMALLPLIITLGLSLVAIVLTIILLKKKTALSQNSSQGKNKFPGISVACFVLGAAAFIVALHFMIQYFKLSEIVTDVSFMDIAENSVQKAHEYIKQRSTAMWIMLICPVVGIGLIVLGFFLKKRAARPKPTPTPPPFNPTAGYGLASENPNPLETAPMAEEPQMPQFQPEETTQGFYQEPELNQTNDEVIQEDVSSKFADIAEPMEQSGISEAPEAISNPEETNYFSRPDDL